MDKIFFFGPADNANVQHLFTLFYAARGLIGAHKATLNGCTHNHETQFAGTEISEDVQSLATKFAALLPGDQFSSAEIQIFLMDYKEDLHRAIQKVPEWIELKRTDSARVP